MGNEGERTGTSSLGFKTGTKTYVLDLTWRSPLSLRDGSLLEEEEDWLPSPDRELPEPADGTDEGRLSLAGRW